MREMERGGREGVLGAKQGMPCSNSPDPLFFLNSLVSLSK